MIASSPSCKDSITHVCIMFHAIFKIMLDINASIHAFLEILLPVLFAIFFPSKWLLSHIPITVTMISCKTMDIIYDIYNQACGIKDIIITSKTSQM